MNAIQKAKETTHQINEIAKTEGKLTGYVIGNTAKNDSNRMYFSPIRHTSVMITGGVIVYSQKQAIDIAKAVDGQVQYILVDAEKKIPDKLSLTGEPANIERAVRETIQHSTLWIYKGNDLTVEAVDTFLTQMTSNNVKGIGGKKIAI